MEMRKETSYICDYNLMVESQSSKLMVRFRLPLVAPYVPLAQTEEHMTLGFTKGSKSSI